MSLPIRASDVKGNTSYDLILRAWLDHKLEELPENLAGMLERWKDVDRLIRHGELVQKVTNKGIVEVQRRFNFANLVEWIREHHNVSFRTAYEDITNAKRFFLSCETREDVEYMRGVSIEHGEMMQWAAFDAGKFEAAAMFFKETNKIKGLHEQRRDLPDYAGFIPPTFVVTTDPTELGFPKVENVDEIARQILNEKRKGFLEDEAQDVEVVDE